MTIGSFKTTSVFCIIGYNVYSCDKGAAGLGVNVTYDVTSSKF